MSVFLAWISQDKPYFCVVQSCPNLSICPEFAVNMMRIIKIWWENLGVPKTRSQKRCPKFTESSLILSRVVQSCPDVFSWVCLFVTLERYKLYVCTCMIFASSSWTNFGQNFGDLDKFGQRFWGLSSNFGQILVKHYIIEETRFLDLG